MTQGITRGDGDGGVCEICEERPAARMAQHVNALVCGDCYADEPCPYTSAAECAMARERSVAGFSDEIPACPEHGAYPGATR